MTKAVKKIAKKAVNSIKASNERGARHKIIEELFYDFNRSRAQVYKINFFRGIALGAGTVIGGTLVIALVVYILSLLANVIPPLDGFFNGISQTIDSTQN